VIDLIIMIGKLGTKGLEYMILVLVLTVLLSVFLHGISAIPHSQLYGRYASAGDKPTKPG